MENKKLYEDINRIVNARTQRIDEEILEEGKLAGKLLNAVLGLAMLILPGVSPAELKAEAPKTTEVGKEAGKKDDRTNIFKKVMLIPDDNVRLTRSGISKNEQTKDMVEIVQIKINNKFVYGFKDYHDYRKSGKINLIIPDPTTEDYVTEFQSFKLEGGRDFWTLRGGFKANDPIFKKYTSIVQKLNKK